MPMLESGVTGYDEYAKFARMKEKMKAKGKISDSGSDGEDDEFAEF